MLLPDDALRPSLITIHFFPRLTPHVHTTPYLPKVCMYIGTYEHEAVHVHVQTYVLGYGYLHCTPYVPTPYGV